MKIEYNDKNELLGEISEDLSWNIEFIKTVFRGDKDIVMKELCSGGGNSFFVVYVDGLTDSFMVERSIIKPLLDYQGE